MRNVRKTSRARREAEELITRYDLRVPIDLHSLTEILNIDLQRRPFEDHLSGLLFLDNDSTTIGVNSNHAPVRQRFTIAHEIGHYLLHRSAKKLFVDETPIFFRRDASPADVEEEREANEFAAELLMPESEVRDRVGSYIDLYDEASIRRLAREFGVSPHALTIRLQKLRFA